MNIYQEKKPKENVFSSYETNKVAPSSHEIVQMIWDSGI